MTATHPRTTGTRKESALSFLQLSASGKPREGFARYAAPGFRHHNVYFPSDAESLIAGMDENARQHPDKTITVHRALEDGDFVAVHSHVRLRPGEPGVALVHLFRFEGERIAELWDLGQPVPKDSPNENGMF
jgi:predicted SnoaL-like aldol condensation-catalyzing enzyme